MRRMQYHARVGKARGGTGREESSRATGRCQCVVQDLLCKVFRPKELGRWPLTARDDAVTLTSTEEVATRMYTL